jgi:hypothetical protein
MARPTVLPQGAEIMMSNRNRHISAAARILDRLRMGGKKTVVACALVSIMLFMWARVLIGHRPAAADAASPSRAGATVPDRGAVKVTLVELPKTPGRHDTIARDFFAAPEGSFIRRDTADHNTGTEKEVPIVSLSNVQEVIQRVARKLKLEAVLWSESPRAFLNDQLLAVGSKLTVKDGTASFEFEVLQIYMDSVLVGCDDMQLTLKLAQNLEGNK